MHRLNSVLLPSKNPTIIYVGSYFKTHNCSKLLFNYLLGIYPFKLNVFYLRTS